MRERDRGKRERDDWWNVARFMVYQCDTKAAFTGHHFFLCRTLALLRSDYHCLWTKLQTHYDQLFHGTFKMLQLFMMSESDTQIHTQIHFHTCVWVSEWIRKSAEDFRWRPQPLLLCTRRLNNIVENCSGEWGISLERLRHSIFSQYQLRNLILILKAMKWLGMSWIIKAH